MKIEINLEEPELCNNCPVLTCGTCVFFGFVGDGKEVTEVSKKVFSLVFKGIKRPQQCIERFGV